MSWIVVSQILLSFILDFFAVRGWLRKSSISNLLAFWSVTNDGKVSFCHLGSFRLIRVTTFPPWPLACFQSYLYPRVTHGKKFQSDQNRENVRGPQFGGREKHSSETQRSFVYRIALSPSTSPPPFIVISPGSGTVVSWEFPEFFKPSSTCLHQEQLPLRPTDRAMRL